MRPQLRSAPPLHCEPLERAVETELDLAVAGIGAYSVRGSNEVRAGLPGTFQSTNTDGEFHARKRLRAFGVWGFGPALRNQEITLRASPPPTCRITCEVAKPMPHNWHRGVCSESQCKILSFAFFRQSLTAFQKER